MSGCIVYFSKTGNNKMFAEKLCLETQLDLYPVALETSMKSIVLDIIFARIPKVSIANFERYDFVLVVGPVWMQHLATPLRAVLKQIKTKEKAYGVMTVCGGALNSNPKLKKYLVKRAGTKMKVFKQFYTKDLMDDDNIKMADTSEYCLDEENTKKFMAQAITLLGNL